MPSESDTRGRRARIWTLLKALLAVAILAALFTKVPLRDLGARLARIDAADLAVLLAVTTLQVAIGVARWWRMLARLGERVSFVALFGDTLVGLAYNLFLPTTVGGDVVRAWRASRRVSRGHAAWSTSVFERIAGLLAMATTGAVAALAAVGSLVSVPPTVRWLAAGLALAFLVVFFFAAAPFRLLARALERRLPEAASRDLRGVAQDLAGPLATFGARAEAFAWSLLYQAAGILFVIVGARAIGAPGHALAIAAGVPLVHVLSMLPVTLGGHGLREGLFVGILGELGVAPDVALGLAAQWLGSSVFFAVLGAVVAMLSSSRARPVPEVAEP